VPSVNDRPDDVQGTLATSGGPDTQVHPAPPGAPPAADSSSQRYQLRGEIAHGGMGTVFAARDRVLNRDVAVKVLREEFRHHASALRRFIEEGQITAQIQHPGVPPVHDCGNLPDGRPFIAMKLIKGRTLSELLGERPDPKYDLPRYLTVVEQVCQAVAYAHSKGVIHRDLKPGNVMVGAFGEVQVMDWGLAKVLADGPTHADRFAEQTPEEPLQSVIESGRQADSATQAGSLLGTPAYMPPEQARGEIEHTDRRSDVFAIGAILCEVLTGRPPYIGSMKEMQALAVVGHQAAALERLAGCGADAELVELAKHCLTPRPEGRPADAGAVAEALATYRSGVEGRLRKAEVEAAATAARAAEERKRRRFQMVTAIAVLVSAGGIGWLWERQVLARRAERSRQEAQMREGVDAALGQAEDELRHERLEVAGAALAQAEKRLADDGPDDLRERLTRDQRDLAMARELDRILERRWTMVDGKYDLDFARRQYPIAFRDYGLPTGDTPAPALAEVVQASTIQKRLIDGLDEWYAVDPVPAVAELLGAADPDPARTAIRTALQNKAHSDWQSLVRRLETDSLPSGFIACVCGGDRLPVDESVRLLHAAQARQPDRFTLTFLLANKLWDRVGKDRQDAIGYYRAALALRPHSVAACINLAIALNEFGDHDGSLACCRRAVELDPKYSYAHNNLGVALASTGDIEGALACYRKAVELDPTNATAHRNLGIVQDLKGNHDASIASIRKSVEVEPRFVVGYNSLGVVLKKKGDLDGAIAAWRKSVEIDPKNVLALRSLGLSLKEKGDLPGAVDYYHKALAIDPGHALTYDNLGLALDTKGDLAEAADAFRKAAELDLKNGLYQRQLGIVLFRKNQVNASITAFRKAIELDPKDSVAWDNLGVALNSKADYAGSIAAYRKAIELDPKDILAHKNLAIALGNRGDREGAVANWRKAVAIDPKDTAALSGLGVALWQKKEFDEAIDVFHRTIALDPKQPLAYMRLGLVLKDKGDRDAAVDAYRKAAELNPRYAAAYVSLGDTLFAAGRFDESRDAYQKWLEIAGSGDRSRSEVEQHLREAEQLAALQTRLPDFLAARATPANAGEALALSHYCRQSNRNAGWARFAEAAFAADPATKPAERYDAACAACLAAAGEGVDPPPEADRPGLRHRAIGWLQEELAARQKLLVDHPDSERVTVLADLKHWQEDSDLVSVRDSAALTKLPAAERTEWEAFWRTVGALRRKAEGPAKAP
jgi:tetratricopeptide (TPR) repeat protein